MILYVKAAHLFVMVAWMVGIFYLPRIFVYHAQAEHDEVKATLNIMQRRLFWFVTPFALLTVVTGIWMIILYGGAWFSVSGWLHAKLAIIIGLIGYHAYMWVLHQAFVRGENKHGHVFYRWFNELPVFALLAIVILAIVKPF